MKQSIYTSGAARYSLTLATAILLLGAGGVLQAAIVDVVPDELVRIDLGAAAEGDETGVLWQNSNIGGQVTVELQPNPHTGLQIPSGFVLLDKTLYVKFTPNEVGRRAGTRLIRARFDYGRYGGRAGLRARGIRANTIRLLRADLARGRWVRAISGIRDTRRADIRYLRATPVDFILGHHGFDEKNEVAWAVLDSQGEQYFALAGLANVPVPAAWLLFLSGSGLLVMVTRRKAKHGI